MFVALLYTFLLTPVQVAFLATTPIWIFVLNRLVDVVIAADIFLIFFVAFEKHKTPRRKIWVTDLTSISKEYVTSFFIPDLLGLLSSTVEIVEYCNVDVQSSAPTKAIRFLRFLRMARVFRMSRVVILVEGLQMTISDLLSTVFQIPYVWLELVMWFLKIMMLAHVLACVWGLVSYVQELQSDGNVKTWLGNIESSNSWSMDRQADVGKIYLLALYWSITSLVTVGFGDIIPWTLPEHVVSTIIMMVAGICWPMLMARICSVVGAVDAERLELGLDMDMLAGLCRERQLDQPLRARLQTFLVRKQRLKRLHNQQELMQTFSPALRGEVALCVTRNFLQKVDFLKVKEQDEDKLLSLYWRLAEQLEMFAIAPDEWVVPASLEAHVSSEAELTNAGLPASLRGKAGNAKASGSGASSASSDESGDAFIFTGFLPASRDFVAPLTYMDGGVAVLDYLRLAPTWWHEDMILASPYLRNNQVARAVVFCTIYTLCPDALFACLQDGFYTQIERQVRFRAVQLAIHRLMQMAVKGRSQGNISLVDAINKALAGPLAGPAPQQEPKKKEEATGTELMLQSLLDRLNALDARQAALELRRETTTFL